MIENKGSLQKIWKEYAKGLPPDMSEDLAKDMYFCFMLGAVSSLYEMFKDDNPENNVESLLAEIAVFKEQTTSDHKFPEQSLKIQ